MPERLSSIRPALPERLGNLRNHVPSKSAADWLDVHRLDTYKMGRARRRGLCLAVVMVVVGRGCV